MKKRAVVWLAALMLMLSGCSAAQPVWETVEDAQCVVSGSWLDAGYTMLFSVPQDAQIDPLASQAGCTVYAQADGGYEIVGQTLLCVDLESAVKRVSGFSAEDLAIIETQRFGLPEYQFVWYAQSDEGGRVCRADVLLDGTYAYALTFSAPEENASAYDTTAQAVFATLGLYENEGF